MSGPLRPADLLIALVEECDSLLEEARFAEDGDEIHRLKRIRNDAMIELASAPGGFGTTA